MIFTDDILVQRFRYYVMQLSVKSRGYSNHSDFKYLRYDSNSNSHREFSVDLLASKEHKNLHVYLLVECKYRHLMAEQDANWLFFPFENDEEMFALPVIDQFSETRVESGNNNFNRTVYSKAVEVRGDSVRKDEIAHGVHQLQYGLPTLFRNIIVDSVATLKNRLPFVIIPVLLTNARLYAYNNKEIKEADNFEEIGIPVEHLIYYNSSGNEFERHYSKVFKEMKNLNENTRLQALDRQKTESGSHSPVELIHLLLAGDRQTIQNFFCYYFITEFNTFDALLDGIISEVRIT